MRSRCTNKNTDSYRNYGGRGIRVCKEWRDSFETFLAHLKTLLPADATDIPRGMSLERKDNDGPYNSHNVILATATEQARNKRTAVWITIDGQTRWLQDWLKDYGISYGLYKKRREMGRDPVAAIVTPKGKRLKKRLGQVDLEVVTIGNETRTVVDWLAHFGVKKSTYLSRCKLYGWSPVEALTTPVTAEATQAAVRRLASRGRDSKNGVVAGGPRCNGVNLR